MLCYNKIMNKEDFPSQQNDEVSAEMPPVGSDSYIFEKYGMTREDVVGYLRRNPQSVDFFADELEPKEDDHLEDMLEQMENDSLREDSEPDNIESLDFGSSRHQQVEGQVSLGQTIDQSEEKMSYGEGAMDLRERYQVISAIMADLNELSQARGFLKKCESGHVEDLLERYTPKELEDIKTRKLNTHRRLPFKIRDNVLKLLGDVETIKQVFPEYDDQAHQRELEAEINQVYGANLEDARKRRAQKLKHTYNPDQPKK